eukprot:scaffold153035_cov23-Tisochrysis_lutea.AAC.1
MGREGKKGDEYERKESRVQGKRRVLSLARGKRRQRERERNSRERGKEREVGLRRGGERPGEREERTVVSAQEGMRIYISP